MISSILLKFGSSPSQSNGHIPVAPVTVFVGPNNSGKSRILAEIEQYCRTGNGLVPSYILEALEFTGLKELEATQAVERLIQKPHAHEILDNGDVVIGSRQGRQFLNHKNLMRLLDNPHENIGAFCSWFLTHNTLKLSGQGRTGLLGQQAMGDLQEQPASSLQALFLNDEKREQVRKIVHEAFGVHFVMDPTCGGSLRVRLSAIPPDGVIQERALTDDAIRFHANALPIDLASDGVKAFAGIVAEVIAGEPRVLLLDEAEAFLHPPLATRLGLEISKAASTTGKNVFVATHSPAFLMGCIQSGVPVTIVRLTYRDGVPTARSLESQGLIKMMRNPLLRSANVLSGLFYEYVVVAESDADRAFYQEVNERLLRFDPERGIPNCLFLNAQNKQTVHVIVKALRRLGIPVATIIDIDAVKEGGAVWTSLLGGAYIPDELHNVFGVHRGNVYASFRATGRDLKRDGGINLLRDGEKASAESLLQNLAEYGVFVIPGGELESWLPDLNSSGHGPEWLVQVFEMMGEDPTSDSYVRPGTGDVWDFMGRVKNWLVSPGRKGIPE